MGRAQRKKFLRSEYRWRWSKVNPSLEEDEGIMR